MPQMRHHILRHSSENCELNGIDFITGAGNMLVGNSPWSLKSSFSGLVAVVAQPKGMRVGVCTNGQLHQALVQSLPLQTVWSHTTHNLATDYQSCGQLKLK
jgi:hypothetical protein